MSSFGAGWFKSTSIFISTPCPFCLGKFSPNLLVIAAKIIASTLHKAEAGIRREITAAEEVCRLPA